MASGSPAEPVIGGNVYPKYATRNPIARALVQGFLRSLDELAAATGARRVHEIGCGEGHLLQRFRDAGLEARGSDLSASAIEEARLRFGGATTKVPLQVRDLHQLAPPDDAEELIVCCEVLEHVPDPERAFATLARLARPHLIVSVPREPLWRVLNVARGKYLKALGNTPGHLQHFSTRAIAALAARHVQVVELRTPLPWTMLRCRAH